MNANSNSSGKKLPLILSLLLIIPFALMIIFFIQSASFRGDVIKDVSQTFTVSVKDGKVTTPSQVFETPATHVGPYEMIMSFESGENGFPVGVLVKTAEGNIASCFTACGMKDLPCNVTLTSGKNVLELHFLDDEDAMRDFAMTYLNYAEGPALDQFVSAYDYPVTLKDGDESFTFSLKVTECVTAPVLLQIVTLAVGALILLMLFLCLTGEPSEGVTLKERLDRLGNRYAIFAITVIFTQMLVIVLMRNLAPDFTNQNSIFLSLLLTIIAVDVVGFPVTYLVCRNVPAQPLEKKKLGFGKFLLFVLMSAGICGVGSIIGAFVHRLITLPVGGADAAITTLMLNSGMGMRILTVGIMAPIFEELLFRKLLIDRLAKYGEFISIFTSGLLFGLFHGNFQQFFFAFGLGCLFAFVYLRTGRVIYTIGLHMVINMSTSAITVWLLGKYSEYAPASTDPNAVAAAMQASPEAMLYTTLYSFWNIFLALAAIVGAIILIVFLAKGKFRLKHAEGEESRGEALKALFTSRLTWAFFLSTISLFLLSYLPAYL